MTTSVVGRSAKILSCALAFASIAASQWRTGYFIEGNMVGQTAATIPWSKYTHVIQYALKPTFSGDTCTLDTAQINGASIRNFVSYAHAAGVQAIIGISEDTPLTGIIRCTTPQNIATFVALVSAFVSANQYDGVDIEWGDSVVQTQYLDFVSGLRASLPKATLSAPFRVTDTQYISIAEPYLDQVNIMTLGLDLYQVGKHTENGLPFLLHGDTQSETVDEANLYRLPTLMRFPSKIGLGVPFYGRVEQGCLEPSGAIGVTDPNQTSLNGVSSQFVSYRELVNSRPWSSGTRVWDDLRQIQYIRYIGGSCLTDALIRYSGPEQMLAAVEQMAANKLGGIMTFGLSYEYTAQQVGDARYPLSTAIVDAMVAHTAPVVSNTRRAASPSSFAGILPLAVKRVPPSIGTTSPLPTALTGAVYLQTLTATGTTPIAWSVTSGALPAGLTLGSSTGTISGAPTALGVFTFTIRATNAVGFSSKQLSLTVNAPVTGAGTFTYYVDSTNGSDSNPGTLAKPWKTVAKVNAATLSPGQSVGFKSAGIWRETLAPRQSGTEGNPITFASYGTGAQPLISGADVETGYSNGGSGNVWDKTGISIQPNIVIVSGTIGILVASRAACTAPGNWYWASGTGTLSVYATSNPDSVVEVGQRVTAINLNNQSYININGFHVTGANGVQINDIPDHQAGAIYIPYNNRIPSSHINISNVTDELNSDFGLWAIGVDELSLSNSTFGSVYGFGVTNGITTGDAISIWGHTYWNGSAFVGASPSTNVNMSHLTVRGTFGRQGVSFLNLNGGTFTQNSVSYAGPDSGVDIEPNPGWGINNLTISSNSITRTDSNLGFVLSASPLDNTATLQNINIRSNTVVTGTAGGGIGLAFTGGTNLVDSNIVTGVNSGIGIGVIDGPATLSGNTVTGAGGTGICLFFSDSSENGLTLPTVVTSTGDSGSGCLSAVEVTGSGINGVDATITGGTFTSEAALIGSGIFAANLGVLDTVNAYYNTVWNFNTALKCQRGTGTGVCNFYQNTLSEFYIGLDAQGAVTTTSKNNVFSYTGTGVAFLNYSTNTLASDYNLYYFPNSLTTYWANGSGYPQTLATWQTLCGCETHGLNSNPSFVNAGAGDFSLQTGSPAIGAGIYIPGMSTVDPPNIGAK